MQGNSSLNVHNTRFILVVDDDDDVRSSVRLLLEAEGYAVQDYASAEAFLADTDGREADCLLLDIHMSGLSGLGLLEQLRARGVQTSAIIITADPKHTEIRSAQAGVLTVLRKPPATAEMLDWVEKACALSRGTVAHTSK